MKWKINIYIRYISACLIVPSLISCNNSPGTRLDKTPIETVPVTMAPGTLTTAIHDAMIGIETKDISSSGDSILNINIEGMEVINFSRKDYYLNEMQSQEAGFKNYLQYLERFAHTKSALNDPMRRRESQAKHDAVMTYLNSKIKTASARPEIYKVVYYLKADTKREKYDQLKTTYLDKDLKKIVADYGFLKEAY